MNNTTALTRTPLSLLANAINHHHDLVKSHTKGMLLEAQAAGEKLLQAKKEVEHGEFKPWIAENCWFSYATAKRYMRVAKLHDKGLKVEPFEDGMAAFLDAHAEKKERPAQLNASHFHEEDAEYVLKLNALVERGVGGEADNAARKLDVHAARFGMTGEEVVEKALKVKPEVVENPIEDAMNAEVERLLKPYLSMNKGELLHVILDFVLAQGGK
ncbi:DUF3102 domain-containing protein [Magnetospira sp. QH-2]|uniref:DUF3102 domain-containing protein n=1 Tax=Magnetospira sp. (strain QH-2) TaxID=1288970 RepID=UPI0003E81985|nr:DUF3102 domain-containing protein [Magnetospira sp. QH-2]CCQ73919.1 Protein of unknown function [Magnetospira sp. QH-2]